MHNLFKSFNGGVNNWLFAIDHTYNILNDKNDPRMSIYFAPGPEAGTTINALPAGEEADPDNDAVVGTFFLKPNAVDPLLTYSEDMILQSEAYARGFVGGTANLVTADAKLRAGITASMEYYGIAAGSITTFLLGVPNLATMTPSDALKLIAEQQWVNLFNRPLEAWTQWRRTEIPAMVPVPGALAANMIRRWQYPPLEVSANTKTPTQKDLDVKLWFDK